MNELLKILDGIKQYVLAIAGGLYAFGLLSWSIYSYIHNLGHITSFDTQYFITGIGPALFALYLIWLFKFRKSHSQRANGYLKRHPVIFQFIKLIFWIIFYTYLADIIILSKIFKPGIFAYIGSIIPALPTWITAILLFICLNTLLLFSSILFMIRGNKENNAQANANIFRKINIAIKNFMFHYSNIFLWLFTISLTLLLIIYYYESLYPNIPMELGGVKTKKTILVLNSNDFPIEDRNSIFQDSIGIQSGRTDTLLVYFYNDSKFIFKIKKDVVTEGPSAKAFEIDRNLIKSVKWIE